MSNTAICRDYFPTSFLLAFFWFFACSFRFWFTDKGLNFSEQVQSCQSIGSVLFYARSLEEMEFVWDHIYKPTQLDYPMENLFTSGNWFLHMGFERKFRNSSNKYLFTSVDNKMNISTATHPWFKNYGKYFTFTSEGMVFRGPSVCFVENFREWTVERPHECLPRLRRSFSVCFVDFI